MGLDFTRYKYIAIGVAIFLSAKIYSILQSNILSFNFLFSYPVHLRFSNVISCLFHFFFLSSSRIWVTLFEYLAFLLMAI